MKWSRLAFAVAAMLAFGRVWAADASGDAASTREAESGATDEGVYSRGASRVDEPGSARTNQVHADDVSSGGAPATSPHVDDGSGGGAPATSPNAGDDRHTARQGAVDPVGPEEGERQQQIWSTP